MKTKKELIADAKLIGLNVKPYKWRFMSRKKLERIVKWRPKLIDFRKNGGTEIEWTKANEAYATYLNDNISAFKEEVDRQTEPVNFADPEKENEMEKKLKIYVRALKKEISKKDETVEMIKERVRNELREQGWNDKEIKALESVYEEHK